MPSSDNGDKKPAKPGPKRLSVYQRQKKAREERVFRDAVPLLMVREALGLARPRASNEEPKRTFTDCKVPLVGDGRLVKAIVREELRDYIAERLEDARRQDRDRPGSVEEVMTALFEIETRHADPLQRTLWKLCEKHGLAAVRRHLDKWERVGLQ